MSAFARHMSHHGRHMLVCLVSAVGLVAGLSWSLPALAIAGGLVCAASCGLMIRALVHGGHAEHRRPA
jgi:hypothetical protein